MTVLFSRQCEYGIQAALVLATKKHEGWTALSEITARINVPNHYMAKILQNMARDGLLDSWKGPQGGFKLAKPAAQITLLEIVEAIDGTGFLKKCVLGFPDCSSDDPCPIHKTWEKVREQLVNSLGKKSLADMSKETHHKFNPLD